MADIRLEEEEETFDNNFCQKFIGCVAPTDGFELLYLMRRIHMWDETDEISSNLCIKGALIECSPSKIANGITNNILITSVEGGREVIRFRSCHIASHISTSEASTSRQGEEGIGSRG